MRKQIIAYKELDSTHFVVGIELDQFEVDSLKCFFRAYAKIRNVIGVQKIWEVVNKAILTLSKETKSTKNAGVFTSLFLVLVICCMFFTSCTKDPEPQPKEPTSQGGCPPPPQPVPIPHKP